MIEAYALLYIGCALVWSICILAGLTYDLSAYTWDPKPKVQRARRALVTAWFWPLLIVLWALVGVAQALSGAVKGIATLIRYR